MQGDEKLNFNRNELTDAIDSVEPVQQSSKQSRSGITAKLQRLFPLVEGSKNINYKFIRIPRRRGNPEYTTLFH